MTVNDPNWTVVTGSTGGIGNEIVKILAKRGDALILVNRSETKALAQRDEICSVYPEARIELVTADLMDIAQILDATAKINAFTGKIKALYNNSGVLTGEKILSKQGFESQFAVNTLAPYLFIRNLRSKMSTAETGAPAMIINLSSGAITSLKTLDLDNLARPEKVGGLMSTYAQTKLAATALAPALAEGLKTENVLIRAIDPGATKTAMTTGGNSGMPKFLSLLAPLLFQPADKQAAKLVDSADPAAFGGRTGIFVANRKEKKLPAPAADPKMQKDLVSLLDELSNMQ